MSARLMRMTWAMQRKLLPDLRYSQAQFEEHLRRWAGEGRSWLDLGCGHQLLSQWRGDAEAELIGSHPFVVGIDYDWPSLVRHRSISMRCRASAGALPFADASFDLVTANMVVEHLSDPRSQFAEIARVLRPGGIFLFHTPNARSYVIQAARVFPDSVKRLAARRFEDRAAEDVVPTHHAANTPETIAEVASASRVTVDYVNAILSAPVTSVIPPLTAPDLLFIRQLRREKLAWLRPDRICALRKSGGDRVPRRAASSGARDGAGATR